MTNRLSVSGLTVDFFTDDGVVHAVRGVDFTIKEGVRVGFVGESGSGKTTTALSLMGMIEPPGRVTAGSAHLDGVDLLGLDEEEHRRARLQDISYIPQGAMNSLNPVVRVGHQLVDGLLDHGVRLGRQERRERVLDLLAQVGLGPEVAGLFPHQLSGGMKQRVCIAIAIALSPKLIIADEPTSALDVVTQRRVMETLRGLQAGIGASLVLIGHDMGLMAQFVDEIMVMRDGLIVEQGPARELFRSPGHSYTRTLIESVPSLAHGRSSNGEPLAVGPSNGAPADPPLIEIDGVGKVYRRGALSRGGTVALEPLSFTLQGDRPLVISVVGQSGSGKTTLGSLMLGFERPTTGQVRFLGRDIGAFSGADRQEYRREVQAVFQDPYATYNPFYKVDHALVRPLVNFGLASGRDQIYEKMVDACRAVGLEPSQTVHRFAHQLSGGQRQRLMVGRAIMIAPRLMIADEPVSMVDASLRASILENLRQLKERHGASIVYITHDLATAYQISDYILVLYKGRVVEAGDAEVVIKDPRHPYTQLLVDSIPWPDPDKSWGRLGLSSDPAPPLDGGAKAGAVVRSEIEGFTLDA